MDRRKRLAAQIVKDRGWYPNVVSTWVVLAASGTNARRLAEHRTVLRTAFPGGVREIRLWLRDPARPVAALSLWSEPARKVAPTRRVRRQRARA